MENTSSSPGNLFREVFSIRLYPPSPLTEKKEERDTALNYQKYCITVEGCPVLTPNRALTTQDSGGWALGSPSPLQSLITFHRKP